MNRTFQSVLITLFFFVMMFFLFRDHVVPSLTRGHGVDVDRRVLADSWSNQDDWMAIRLGDQKLGAVRTTAEEDEHKSGYTMTSNLQIDGGLIKGRLISAAHLNRRLELESIRLRAQIAAFGMTVAGPKELDAEELPAGALEVVGRVDGTAAKFRVRRGDSTQYFQQHLARPVTLSDSITPVLRGRMLNQNVDYALDVYDPIFGNNAGSVTVTYLRDDVESVDGDRVSVRKVQIKYQTTKMLLTVDPNGNVIRREIPLLVPNAAETASNSAKVPTLVLERWNASEARRTWPELGYVPHAPIVTDAEVTGENKGELLQGVNLFSLIGSGSRGK